MKTDLTDQQIASYRENGYVVIENFLTPEELEQWREAVDEAVQNRNAQKLPADREDFVDKQESYYDNVFIQRLNLWKDHSKVKELILHPAVGDLAARLEGVERMRVWHDQALIKRPWDNPTSWHLDCPYWSFSSRHATSIWVALDDATHQNGCMYFIPGTHKTATFDNAGIGQNMNELFKVYPKWRTLPSVAAPMKAGSCSFHNGLLAHGAGANMTPGWRRAMTCGFMPDGSTFNGKQNILSREQMAKLKVGDLLNDPQQNPIIGFDAN